MNHLFKKDQILTIPNLLSLFRLLLIPLIVWLYRSGHTYAAVAVVLLSGLTDVVDGVVARNCNSVTDLGKVLDPVADKLTQAALIFCLLRRYFWMRLLLVLFALKELAMIIAGYLTLKKKHQVNSAQWFGKLTTVVLYIVMALLFLFPTIPLPAANTLIALCAVLILLSLVKYLLFYRRLFQEK